MLFLKDAGRGWRKVVPSPKPIDIHEAETINTLIKNDIITISCGGGGIPVVGQELKGVEAVIDKDFASKTSRISGCGCTSYFNWRGLCVH